MRRQENEGFTVWLTGLSGTGKSTIAQLLASRLRKRGRLVEVLDGDELRSQFCKDLGFSRADREVQTERLGFLCELLNRNRVIAIVAAISPFRSARDRVRGRIHNFLEVFLDSPLEVLAQRDPKGLYDKAQRGEILDFTGISDPYEPPVSPELAVRTDLCDPTESLRSIWHLLESRKLI
jgi:adenylylsulfate kinase